VFLFRPQRRVPRPGAPGSTDGGEGRWRSDGLDGHRSGYIEIGGDVTLVGKVAVAFCNATVRFRKVARRARGVGAPLHVGSVRHGVRTSATTASYGQLDTSRPLSHPLRMTRETVDSAVLREQVRHVYWIGGGSGAGKSTIARRIAAAHGLRVYATDDVMSEHARRSTIDDAPMLHAFTAMDMDERWVTRPPQTMLETFHWFRGEGFDRIVEDLLHLPREPGVVVEGLRLLPRLVKPLLSTPAHAVWLLPTAEFRRAVIERRGGPAWHFLARTSDPDRALRNLLDRDRMFTDILREETARLEVPAMEVDAAMTEDDLVERVAAAFGL
jgi:2-phosphoglycerate kinase